MAREINTAYVAGSFEERERIKNIMNLLEEKGIRVPTDWTAHVPVYPYAENASLAREYAEEDLNGARDCEVFILIPEKTGGSTQFAELGAAIYSDTVKRVFVVGENNTRSVAFFHPRVERVDTVEQVIRVIRTN